MLQLSPVYNEEQAQVKPPELPLQVPPFWHGLGEQRSPDAGAVKIERQVNGQVNVDFSDKVLEYLT